MQLFVGLIVAGLHFLTAYFVWKKGKVQILAGYVEGEIKDKKKASKYSGIYLIGLGVISVLFPLLPDHFYYVFSFYMISVVVGAVIVNVKVK